MVVKIERLVISRRDIVDDYKTMMRMILAVIRSFSRVFSIYMLVEIMIRSKFIQKHYSPRVS